MPIGNFPDSSSQQILVGIVLVGRLGASSARQPAGEETGKAAGWGWLSENLASQRFALTNSMRSTQNCSRMSSRTVQGGNKCHNPDFLGSSKEAMVFERFMGGCFVLSFGV